jgi:uncharacterized protein (AIM24 family)
MMYMTDKVTMGLAAIGGMSVGFNCMLTGQEFFISDYTLRGPVRLGQSLLVPTSSKRLCD